jgi:energy-coupling factor transporter ATP-binding protein EcfA2
MRVTAVILRNFRAYKGQVRIPIDADLTAFIGRNDVGKSSIFDALAIFYDSPLVKFDRSDLCVYAEDREVRIGCVFDELPESLTLDATAATTLKDEYLLNEDGYLEIHKVFECSSTSPRPRILARALHPTANGCSDLLQLKNAELKQRLKEQRVKPDGVDQRSNPSLRRALWASCDDLCLDVSDIELNTEDAKRVWEQLQTYLPLFALFRADRPSTDEDSEVQDPMKLAVRQALSELAEELQEIQQKVRTSALGVARRTVDKLAAFDPDLARDLSPAFRSDPKWESLFKLALETEDGIPLNNRGSGVRRLVLLSFFQAEAERLGAENGRANVIYAIEEPETSQHPASQRVVIDTLKSLAAAENRQVVITTHVPGLAQFVPVHALRYIRLGEDGVPAVETGDNDVFERVASELGVLPDNRVRVVVCVEGPNDVAFLTNLARVLISGGHGDVIDFQASPEVVLLPLGGSTLRDWVDSNYLKELRRPEVHIYDRDSDSDTPPKYQKEVEAVDSRGDGSKGFLTEKREAENYLHPDAIRQVLQVEVDVSDWDKDDVPEAVAQALHEQSGAEKAWEELDDETRRKKIGHAKKRLNHDVAKAMTVEMLEERGALSEVLGWFEAISQLARGHAG